MTDKSLDQIVASHRALGDKLRRHFDAHAAGEGLSPKAALKDAEETLARLKERLEATVRARQQALERYDQEIQRLQQEIAGRGEQIRERKEAISRVEVNVRNVKAVPAVGKQINRR